MANTPTDESRSRMSKLQSRMRSRFSLDNPEIHSCYWKSTSESSLTNVYGTRRNRNRLVVGRATTYKRGMTVPESKPTPTASNHRTGSAGRKHLGAHLPAEITSSVNKRTWRRVNSAPGDEAASEFRKRYMDTQTSDSKHTWRRCGKHTRRNACEQLEMISAPSTGRMSSVPTSAPTWRMISATARAPERRWEVKRVWSMPNECNYVYRSSSERDRKWSSNVPNRLPNGIARDSHRMASWDRRDNYQKIITGLPRMEGAGT